MKEVKFNVDSSANITKEPELTTTHGVDTEFGNTARDNILWFQLQNEVGNLLTITNVGGQITITMTSKSGAVLGTGTFNISEQDMFSIVQVDLNHSLKRLEFLRKNGSKLYCDLSELYQKIDDEVSRATQAEQQLEAKKQNTLVAQDAIQLTPTPAGPVNIKVKYDDTSVKLNQSNQLYVNLQTNVQVPLTQTRLTSLQYSGSSYSLTQTRHVTSSNQGYPFSTVAALEAGPYFYYGTPYTPMSGDTATVTDSGNDHLNKQATYQYDGTNWNFKETIGHSYKMEENGNFIIQ